MKVVVIGGTGHIGTFLIPRLVEAGHVVTVISRGKRGPYQSHPAWKDVRRVVLDRVTIEAEGTFGNEIKKLSPEVVMDMTCFDVASARQLVNALHGFIQLLVHCGTVWVQGYPTITPMTEELPRHPLTEYGNKKNDIENYLLDQARRNQFPATILHPGHIVGPGWVPVGPTACHDPGVFIKLARGNPIVLPNLGLETLHHVHADDVAQAFYLALVNWRSSVGESFFVVSESSLTLRGYAEAAAGWFGQKANLEFQPISQWKSSLPPEFVESAVTHLLHSTNCSCQKAIKMLGYHPRYTSLAAVHESVKWLVENKVISLVDP